MVFGEFWAHKHCDQGGPKRNRNKQGVEEIAYTELHVEAETEPPVEAEAEPMVEAETEPMVEAETEPRVEDEHPAQNEDQGQVEQKKSTERQN